MKKMIVILSILIKSVQAHFREFVVWSTVVQKEVKQACGL